MVRRSRHRLSAPGSPGARAAPSSLLVAHERLRFAIQPLVELHRERGLEVEVIDVQDLYDEFNDGIVHPRAIHEFFRYTHESWRQPAPRYALLVGDASFDPRSSATVNEEDDDDRVFRPAAGLERERAGGYWYADRNRESHRNLIPTFTYAGSDGQAASDSGFVDFVAEKGGTASSSNSTVCASIPTREGAMPRRARSYSEPSTRVSSWSTSTATGAGSSGRPDDRI